MTAALEKTFQHIDQVLLGYEAQINAGAALPLAPTVESAIEWVGQLMSAYSLARTGEAIAAQGDVLEVFKAFVKGDPSLNAIRDNVRELVYYKNCIAAVRLDALPAKPANMAVRTARHIYLYLRTRQLKEGERADG